MFTNRLAQLPDGVELSYTDSGPVSGSIDYTTLIILHGSAFNGRGFEKLHKLASRYNMRTIILQRREYPGSTKYSDEELSDLKNGRKIFIDRLGLLLAHFSQHLVDQFNIPQLGANGKSGGIAVLGWSFGAATAMSLFSDITVIPARMRANLEKYIRSLVLYDPPYLAYGYELPEGSKVYIPLPEATPNQITEDLYANFKSWVSSYYTLPIDWSGDINRLDHRRRTEVMTTDSWTAEEHQSYFTVEATIRSDWDMFHEPMQTTLRNMTYQVLYNEDLAQTSFPAASVTLIRPDRTNWQCVWGSWVTQKLHQERKDQGEKIRPLNVVPLKNCNHFAHYDFPDEFLEAVRTGIS